MLKQTLIISPEPWNGHFVSKHHYAIELSKNNSNVYFLDPPNNNLKNIQVISTEYENIFNIQAPQVAKGLQYMPKIIRESLESRWLKKLENKVGRIDTIWLFENSRFYDMNFAKDRLKIYHQMDYNQNFHVKEAAKSSDICFCISNSIKNRLTKYVSKDKVHLLGHGLALYNDNIPLDSNDLSILNLYKINCVYIGNVDSKYLYIELFKELVNRFHNIAFHFIGAYNQNKEFFQKISKFENAIFWGKLDHKKVISLLPEFDITLYANKLLTKEDKLQATNAHKMLEYLYGGNVIVTSYLADLSNQKDLMQMSSEEFDIEDFILLFNETIEHLSYYNSQELINKRREYALNRTYQKRLSQIFNILKMNSLIGEKNAVKI